MVDSKLITLTLAILGLATDKLYWRGAQPQSDVTATRCRRQQMTKLPEEFDFLADDSVDKDTKRILLEAILEDRRYERDAARKAKETEKSLALEKKKFWHKTPLMLAFVGTIAVFASGLVAYVQAAQLPVVGIEQIQFNKVVEIGELDDAAPYTEVQQDDGHWMAVREKPQVLLRRLEGKTLMANFTRPNGKTVWVKAAAVAQVRDSDSDFNGPAKTQLLLVNKAMQAVTESPPIVAAAIIAEASLKKLTTPNDKAVWVNADVSHIIGKVPANNPGSAMLEVANRRISVKESVADAEAILKGPQP
jgi:hypothetical protein